MKLRDLWTQAKTLHRDIWEPFRNPVCWPDTRTQHVLAHVLGGIAVYLLALWLGVAPVKGVLAFHLGWVFWVEEANSTRGMRYPLWSMVWDAGIPTLTAWLLSRVPIHG